MGTSDENKQALEAQLDQQSVELKELIIGGFREQRVDMALMRGEITGVKERVGHLEEFKKSSEERMRSHSERAASITTKTSNSDLSVQAAQASLITLQYRVDALDVKQDKQLANQDQQLVILSFLQKTTKGITKNPYVRSIFTVLATSLVTWLGINKVKEPTPAIERTVIQYVTIPADAGVNADH